MKKFLSSVVKNIIWSGFIIALTVLLYIKAQQGYSFDIRLQRLTSFLLVVFVLYHSLFTWAAWMMAGIYEKTMTAWENRNEITTAFDSRSIPSLIDLVKKLRSLEKSFPARGFLAWIERSFYMILFVLLVIAVAMSGYLKTGIYLTFAECIWLNGITSCYATAVKARLTLEEYDATTPKGVFVSGFVSVPMQTKKDCQIF